MKIKKSPRGRLTRRRLLGSAVGSFVPWQLTKGHGNLLSMAPNRQVGSNKAFAFPTTGMSVENQALLFAIDDQLLPLKRNVCYYLSKPKVRREPVLAPSLDRPSAPDYASADLYGTVLRDAGKVRMWYLGGQRGPSGPGVFGVAHVCYAESDDGINWRKPDLGQVTSGGNRNNNAIAIPDSETEGVTLIKDEAETNPDRRYKMIYQCRNRDKKYWTVRTATSPNGVDRWKFGAEPAIADFVEFSSLYQHNGLYILNAQTISPFWRSEGGHATGRQGVAWVSTDFDRWLPEAVESFFLPEPADPQKRGGSMHYDQVHLGVGAVSFGNVTIGLYCNWHARGGPGDGLGFAATSGDLGLVVSSDGLLFREPVKGWTFLAAEESTARPAKYGQFPTILEQNNAIFNVGEETRIYHGRWLNLKSPSDWYGEIALATLPRDRWGALGLFPDRTEGSVCSAPITLPAGGCQIYFNADDAGGMKVDVIDEKFQPLPRYSGADGGTIRERSGFDCAVAWRYNFADLAGQTVRLRIHLRRQEGGGNPRLYALYLRSSPAKTNV